MGEGYGATEEWDAAASPQAATLHHRACQPWPYVPDITLALLPQTFIDMEGSGFAGDLESLRVSAGPLLSAGSWRDTLSHCPFFFF